MLWGEEIDSPFGLAIYDLTGRIAFHKEIESGALSAHQHLLDISGLAPGIYVVVMKSENVLNESKLVVR